MNSRLSIVAACVALTITACTGGPASSTTSSTPTKYYADPASWVNVHCQTLGAVQTAGWQLKSQDRADPAGVKEAVLFLNDTMTHWYAEAVRGMERLGPPGPDAEDAHNKLLQLMKKSSEVAAKMDAPLRALEANAAFWANYEKVLASNADPAAAKQFEDVLQSVAANPKYAKVFASTHSCVSVADQAKHDGMKVPW